MCRGAPGPAIAAITASAALTARTPGLPVSARRRPGCAIDPRTAVTATGTLATGSTGPAITAHRASRATIAPGATRPAIHAVTAGLTGLGPSRAVAPGRPIPTGTTGPTTTEVAARTPGATLTAVHARRRGAEPSPALAPVTQNPAGCGAVHPGSARAETSAGNTSLATQPLSLIHI